MLGGAYATEYGTSVSNSIFCGNTYGQFLGTYQDDGGNSFTEKCAPDCPADLNDDGVVNGADLSILLGEWGPCPSPPDPCPADITGDGNVGGADLSILLGGWGPCL